MKRDSVANTFIVATTLCVICSVLVSGAAVSLRSIQEKQKKREEKMTQVELYDTTLRDGAQHEGISLSVEDKLIITDRLDQLGAHQIEEGWPGSNPKDAEFFERAKSFKLKNSVLTAFGSTRRANVKNRELNI